jgi:hypothetical protein
MNRIGLFVVAVALLAWHAPRTFGQPHEPAPDAGTSAQPAEAEAPHDGAPGADAAHEGEAHERGAHDAGPVVPDTRHRWPGPTVFVILCLFLAAAVIGPIVRAHAPEEMPPTHSHDEPPGASHHHGASGTINPIPHDVAKLEQGGAHGHGPGHHH